MDEKRMFLQAILEAQAMNTEEIRRLCGAQERLAAEIQEIKRNQEELLQRQSDWKVREQAPRSYHVFL